MKQNIVFLIYDDDLKFANHLKDLLEETFQGNHYAINIFINEREIKITEESHFFFLVDIEMPEMDGFSLAKRIKEKYNEVPIAFVSSHEHYVFDSFSFEPVCFLRKRKIEEDVHKYVSLIKQKYLWHFCFSSFGEEISIPNSDILYFQKSKNKVLVKTMKRDYEYYDTLERIIRSIDTNTFLFIHRSIIVNLNHILKFEKNMITLSTKEKMMISRNYLKSFKKGYYRNRMNTIEL